MTKKIREKTQCIKLRNKRGDITTDLTEIKKILYEWSHASKLDNLNVINKFLERHNYQNTQEKKTTTTGNLNRLITSKEIELVIKNFPQGKAQEQMALLVNSSNVLSMITTNPSQTLPKLEEYGILL